MKADFNDKKWAPLEDYKCVPGVRFYWTDETGVAYHINHAQNN